MPTIQILTKDNSRTIRACLESAAEVGGRILVADLGSSDGTQDVVRGFGADLIEVKFEGDLSEVRNGLVSDGQNMYLEPWERIAKGSKRIGNLVGSRSFYVMAGGVVSKQVRLWDRGRFKNPVFETLVGAEAVVDPGVVILAEGQPDNRQRNTEACRRWAERRPTSPDPHYYLACSLLAEGKGREFLSVGGKFLSLVMDDDDSYVLMNYYMARQEFVSGNARQAYRRALECVFRHPSFAEFWCLLGDMLCYRGQYARAIEMYENARVAGKRRRNDDSFPIEVSKYESYPMTMERRCREALGKLTVASSKEPRNA